MPGKPDDTVTIQQTWYVTSPLPPEPHILTCEPESLSLEPHMDRSSSHGRKTLQ